MVRGAPDYGIYAPKSVTAVMSDMGELAARLGSIVIFDRRGDVVCLDDFESPDIQWLDTDDGVQTVRLDSTSFKSGSQACKLHNKAAAGLGVGIARSFKRLGSDRIGIEISFSNPPDTSYLDIHITHYNGVGRYLAYVQLNFSTKVVQVRISPDAWQVLDSSFKVFEENFCFTPVKLVCDFEAGKYVKLLIGNVEHDLSAYAINYAAGVATPRELVYYDLGNDATATAADIYLDDFILTQNEP